MSVHVEGLAAKYTKVTGVIDHELNEDSVIEPDATFQLVFSADDVVVIGADTIDELRRVLDRATTALDNMAKRANNI